MSQKNERSDLTPTKESYNTGCWESDLKVLSKVTVIVPLKLLMICKHIAERVDGDEFSVVTDIENKSLDTIRLSDLYYIPKQSVTSGSIEYLPDDYHHSVVIHRHPDGFNNFSSTDNKYINLNFELSLLYTLQDDFVNGLYNLRLDEVIIPLPVKIIVDDGIEKIDIINIERRNNLKEFLPLNADRRNDPKETYPTNIDAEEVMHEMLELNHRVDMMESYFYR